jgi:hypothetical protein
LCIEKNNSSIQESYSNNMKCKEVWSFTNIKI